MSLLTFLATVSGGTVLVIFAIGWLIDSFATRGTRYDPHSQQSQAGSLRSWRREQ